MATLSQLHLTSVNSLRPRHGARFRNSPLSSQLLPVGLPPCGVSRLCFSRRVRGVVAKRMEVVAVAEEEEKEGRQGLSFQGASEALAGAVGVFLSAAVPAHAVIMDEAEEMMRFSPEEWVRIYLATGVWLVLYFVVIPLVIYNYLRLRWYKRNFAETYFQFLLVFVFFPGLLLLAPFINFRPFPRDGAEEP